MKSRLTNNISLKLASVFCALVLWLVVNSVNDPTIPQPYYNIPVKLLNTNLITDSNQVYDVLENTDVISRVTVRAPRSVISKMTADNIIATADVSELSSLDTISIKLSTDASIKDIVSITGSIDTVKLKIENKRSKALALRATAVGEVEEGYIIGDITTDQNLVRISGPQSVIDQIARAAVEVDVSGMTSEILTNAEIKFYDANDEEVDISSATLNIKSVSVKVSIGQTSTVPINFSVSGEPGEGSIYTGEITGSGETVRIAGRASVIKNITSIEIPAEALDITDMTEDWQTEVDIRPYLPDNVSLADAGDAIRTITVHIEQERRRRMEIRGERVRITNLPEGYDASISGLDESFIIEVKGLAKDVDPIQVSGISGTVDIEKWMQQRGTDVPEIGFYTVAVDFGLPEGVELARPVNVTLHISELEEEENE
ncbi:MAG: CdaR family protein [Clostridium sp.]|nr:CdaR family protein [Clostridium sp.]